jgi:ribosome-associated heat shock protein Hsp15
MKKDDERSRTRLDKWLWAARFFKTRPLAQDAVDGGKVQYDGQRTKSSRDVQLGARITVTVGYDTREVIVTGLSDKRGNATQAATLYAETPESVIAREEAAAKRRAAALSEPVSDHRPDKKERRQIHRFRDNNT